MATITTGIGLNGATYWAVRSGSGGTQLALCRSEAEAGSIAAHGCDGVASGCVNCIDAYNFYFGVK
jgi:hypothetical protein